LCIESRLAPRSGPNRWAAGDPGVRARRTAGKASLFHSIGVGWRQARRHPRFPLCALCDRGRGYQEVIMRKLIVSTLVTLGRVVQERGGFGETAQGGWAS